MIALICLTSSWKVSAFTESCNTCESCRKSAYSNRTEVQREIQYLGGVENCIDDKGITGKGFLSAECRDKSTVYFHLCRPYEEIHQGQKVALIGGIHDEKWNSCPGSLAFATVETTRELMVTMLNATVRSEYCARILCTMEASCGCTDSYALSGLVCFTISPTNVLVSRAYNNMIFVSPMKQIPTALWVWFR